ncbi:hypothetical protein [Chitinimonas sp.]|uniref:hypothetical protein n=1 Tax=Chitinimonas sp. TaxID=1934313 RepID=UPI002F95E1DC
MKTIAKLIAATVVGLTATYAAAAETTYTDTIRHSSVAFYGAEQVGKVSPDNTDAYRRVAAKQGGEYILISGKKHVTADNTDAFRRAG